MRGERAACAMGRARCEALPVESGTFPEDLEVGVSFSSRGCCHYLFYGLDLKGTAVLHHPFLLPLLSGALAPQISRCAPVTEFHTFLQYALQPCTHVPHLVN